MFEFIVLMLLILNTIYIGCIVSSLSSIATHLENINTNIKNR